MTLSPSSPPYGHIRPQPGDGSAGQRFGHVTGCLPTAASPGDHTGSYLVRDDETGITYACRSTDIVTEGLRTLSAGERVRFLTDPNDPGHAVYVIRLDLPDVEEYYK